MPILERQLLNVVLLGALLVGVAAVVHADPGTTEGSFLGVGADVWLWIAVVLPVLHQLYVAFAWRTELHLRLWTRRFGARAFRRYQIPFLVGLALRPVVVLALAIANHGTLGAPPVLAWGLGLLLLALSAWVGWSVARFFTIRRACGIDHFDPSFRDAPLVRRGVFRWVPNAMYALGFGVLWAIALLLGSKGALLAAAFQHVAIWVHYLCTERPDMRRIYGAR